MLILALDTTTRAGSIAVMRDAQVLGVAGGDGLRTHAERLPADLIELLTSNGLELADLDAFAVAAGPGSFTGLRIGIATVQGLAFALNRPVVGVSALDALAAVAAASASAAVGAEMGGGEHLVAAWMDAQRQEVFAALYEPLEETAGGGHGKRFSTLDGPVSEPPEQVLDRWLALAATGDETVWFAGDGLTRYRAPVEERFGSRARLLDPLPPLAPTIAAIAMDELVAGRAVAPHAIRPIYVRRPDPELKKWGRG